LEENTPPDFDAVRPGPRLLHWRQDVPHTVFWVQALDDGDARRQAEFRDQLWTWTPGQTQPQAWLKLALRYQAIHWATGSRHGRRGLVENRKSITHWVRPDSPAAEPVKLFEVSSEDRYADPGNLSSRCCPTAPEYCSWRGWREPVSGRIRSFAEGDRPFLDKLDLTTAQTTRLFRSSAPYFERPVRLLDNRGKLLLTSREALDSPPNLCLRDLDSDQVSQFTDYGHPAPQLIGVKKEILRYQRSDGVDLTGTLYIRPAMTPKRTGPSPCSYGPTRVNTRAPRRPARSRIRPTGSSAPGGRAAVFRHARLCRLGRPDFPIIGEGEKEPNDTYIEQLVMDAQAAVDEVARQGVGDPQRCAIGGHSYGAFTTVNLLAHSQIFRAGIARSGAYNRTLTPFGFQAEERTFWEAPTPTTVCPRSLTPTKSVRHAFDPRPGG